MHQAFRRGRLRLATVDAAASLLLLVPALLWADGSLRTLILGVIVLSSVALFSYRGGPAGKSALSAVMLGSLPIVLALSSLSLHQACSHHGCSSYCVPACALGGVIAGVIAGRVGARSPRPFLSIVSLLWLIGLTGSIGCSCVGKSGMLALALSLIPTSLLSLLQAKRTS